MAGLAAAGAAKSMGAIVRGFDTRYKIGWEGRKHSLRRQTMDMILMIGWLFFDFQASCFGAV